MSAATLATPAKTAPPKTYPFSDGKRMAENTRQAFWIFLFMANLQALLREIADVLVATDILWYPVEGEEKLCTAPDVLVAFGRPRGHRDSYLQWDEGGIPPQVVVEIVSPSNSWKEMADKFDFYDAHGVQEYYIYDPDRDRLEIYIRGERGAALVRRYPDASGCFVSPLLKIRFDTSGDELRIYRPDGERFLSPEEIEEERQQERERLSKTETRLARMQALVGKLLAGSATPEEMDELRALQVAK